MKVKKLIITTIFINLLAICASAQTTEFSYQGILKSAGAPANGNHDFEFRLFDAASGGTQQGPTNNIGNVAVVNGVYTVMLNFGAGPFNTGDRYLDISVRTSLGGAFTPLSPRQQIKSTPYAIRSLSAGIAGNSLQLGGQPAGDFVQTNDPRLSDGRNPLPGSSSYIQNTTSPQAASNFNVSGTGTANIVSATTQYNLGAQRILSAPGPGTENLMVGINTGTLSTDFSNTFVGRDAGAGNLAAGFGTFIGASAGRSNTSGAANVFVGVEAGQMNTSGGSNTFLGRSAGRNNTDGSSNVFVGISAGQANTTADLNAFFGGSAGDANTEGFANTFIGSDAGGANTLGDNNTFVGRSAGNANVLGIQNTALGRDANVSVDGLNNATAIGAGAIVTASNRVQLGRNNVDTVSVGKLDVAVATNLCVNGTVLAACSSSGRYKENVKPLGSSLSLVQKLRPVTFDWKGRNEHDLGLIAEEVAKIDPLLVTRNPDGEIQGVKYDQLSVVLINAIKEQQAGISDQQSVISGQKSQIDELNSKVKDQNSKIDNLQTQLDALKKLVCAQNPSAEICGANK